MKEIDFTICTNCGSNRAEQRFWTTPNGLVTPILCNTCFTDFAYGKLTYSNI